MLEESAAPPSSAPATPIPATFICGCKDWMRSACAGEPSYEHEGKRYCVLHYPSKEKSAAFNDALRRKLDAKDFNFRGVWFPDEPGVTPFHDFTFSALADFRFATFSAESYFQSATFSAEADFSSATFSAEADFSSITFNAETYFHSTIFKDDVRFAGDERKSGFSKQSPLKLEYAKIEKPERVSFHTLTLQPHWFVNVDARKFDFTNVEWADLKQRDGIKQVIEKVKTNKGSSSHTLLARACRHLAVNAEENHRYEEAAQFRYWAMDVRRRERWRGLAFWKLSWWYWVASGYGERIFQAFLVLFGVWVIFASLYTQVSFAEPPTTLEAESSTAAAKHVEHEKLRELPRALTYSLGVMSLQKPEPRPETTEAQALVAIETVLGPLQAALLALAIRRRFIR